MSQMYQKVHGEGRSNLTEENLLSSMAASRALFFQSPFPVASPLTLTYRI